MRQILENTLEYGVSTFHHFIDFKIAYDTINREELLKAMKEFKIPQKITGLVRATLEHVKYRVKVQYNLSELFGTSVGLRQGDGRTIAQAVSRWLPTAAVRGLSPGLVMWDFIWTKWPWDRFSPSTLVCPANLHSTNCSKNHPHLSSGVCTTGQSGSSTRDLDT
jgi:hypothetical protein